MWRPPPPQLMSRTARTSNVPAHQLVSAIRALVAELGIVAPIGRGLARLRYDPVIPERASALVEPVEDSRAYGPVGRVSAGAAAARSGASKRKP